MIFALEHLVGNAGRDSRHRIVLVRRQLGRPNEFFEQSRGVEFCGVNDPISGLMPSPGQMLRSACAPYVISPIRITNAITGQWRIKGTRRHEKSDRKACLSLIEQIHNNLSTLGRRCHVQRCFALQDWVGPIQKP